MLVLINPKEIFSIREIFRIKFRTTVTTIPVTAPLVANALKGIHGNNIGDNTIPAMYAAKIFITGNNPVSIILENKKPDVFSPERKKIPASIKSK